MVALTTIKASRSRQPPCQDNHHTRRRTGRRHHLSTIHPLTPLIPPHVIATTRQAAPRERMWITGGPKPGHRNNGHLAQQGAHTTPHLARNQHASFTAFTRGKLYSQAFGTLPPTPAYPYHQCGPIPYAWHQPLHILLHPHYVDLHPCMLCHTGAKRCTIRLREPGTRILLARPNPTTGTSVY